MNSVFLIGKATWAKHYGDYMRLQLTVRGRRGRPRLLSVVLNPQQAQAIQAKIDCIVNALQCDERTKRQLRRDPVEALKQHWIAVRGHLEPLLEHGRARLDIVATEVEVLNEKDGSTVRCGIAGAGGPGRGV